MALRPCLHYMSVADKFQEWKILPCLTAKSCYFILFYNYIYVNSAIEYVRWGHMNINVIAHNLLAMNAERTLGVNTGNKTRAMEKLASGYRINRSADDAAGLAISEKMRRLIRGLNQGTENAQDGASWVQIGDGSLDEAHSMLHRMTQLSVQALNGTWTDSDRSAMQAEFEQLQKEIDRLTDASTFNENHIFAEHNVPYYQFEGNIRWMPNQKHIVGENNNTLSITYRMAEGERPQTAEIQVPPGQYTTKELVDEIDSALEKAGLFDKGMRFEFTTQGTCNLNLEGGVSIDEAKGGLAYLLYDVYEGGSTGALIGTTAFESDSPDVKLSIVAGKNDEISFDIVSLDGTTIHKELKVPTEPDLLDPTIKRKGYTRPELIKWLNDSLADTSVRAVPYGKGIKLESDDSIITGLKGNMFKVDDKDKGEDVYTSVFYDNIGYGPVTQKPAVLTGGGVLSTTNDDLEHGYFYINSSNNELLVTPNGGGPAVSLKIQEGYYTADDMRKELNRLFALNHVELEASVYGDKTKDDYQGLVITSQVSGLNTEVGIDPASSAYNTLFVTRAYNKVEESESYVRDPRRDVDASFTGSKLFGTNDWPLEVKAGVNDKFILTVNSKKYEITLDTGAGQTAVYDAVHLLNGAISKAINAVKNTITDPDEAKLLDSIWLSNASSGSTARVKVQSSDRGVDYIGVSAAVGSNGKVNEGYADIFTTQVQYQNNAANGSGHVSLNQQIQVPVTVSGSNQRFEVRLDGVDYRLDLPAKTYNTYEEILQAINNHPNLPKAEVRDDPIRFTGVSASGKNTTFQRKHTGIVTPPAAPVNYAVKGSSGTEQGEVGTDKNATPAVVKMNLPYFKNPPGLTIDGTNGQLKLNVNGVVRTINLDAGTYKSVSALAQNLQKKLNDSGAFGTGDGGIDVTYDSKNLILTTRKKGEDAAILCGSADSKFIEHINTRLEPTSILLNQHVLNSSINIQAGKNDTFKFKYNNKDYTLKLDPGTYNRTSIKEQFNKQLAAQNIGVRAETDSNSSIRLTETVPGNGNTLEFDSENGKGGTCIAALFGDTAVQNQPAEVTIGSDIQEKITIDNTRNTFKITVNGAEQTVTLPAGKTYLSRDAFIKDLDTALKGLGVTASLNGSKIKLTTTATGASARIKVDYDENSALKEIFGTNRNLHRGLKAEFDSSHRLKLTALGVDGKEDGGGEIHVASQYGSIFQKPGKTVVSTAPGTAQTGYHSKIHSAIEGAALRNPTVKINQWNDKLSFRLYYTDTSAYSVNIALERKEYTYDELKEELEKKLNAGLGTTDGRRMTVEVSADGVKIMAENPGNLYRMDEKSFSGGFYYNVLRRTAEQEYKTKPVVTKGRNENATYAVGRKDIRNVTTEITTGVNDTLTLDFTYGNTVKKLSMTLDAGKYSGSALVAHIQKKLNEQLVAEGLEPNLILANVGGINTGVTGNNDKNALTFSLSNSIELPSKDKDTVYTIDGIGGNAAFSVFYQTDGDIRIAYVTGTKDVSGGVTMPKDSDLSFDVDGKRYTITMPAGKYSQEKMLEELNGQLKAAGAPVLAKVTDGMLTLSHTKYGKHQITNISGDAKKWLFFQENGQKEGQKDIWLRVGSESGDGVVIERPNVNTSFLGINSVTISKPKYAEKALARVKKAVTTVSSVRSYFGSMQNRLEHTINQNNNTVENTQAAESAIRDADMAKEMMAMSQSGILENVGQSIMAQANRSRQDVLSLLQ